MPLTRNSPRRAVTLHGQTGAFGRAPWPVNGRSMYQHIIDAQARFLISGSKAAQRILFHRRKA